jgi:hypothetical protein
MVMRSIRLPKMSAIRPLSGLDRALGGGLVDLGIVRAATHEEHQHGRQQADPEHHAPADVAREHGRDRAGQQGRDARADRRAAVHDAQRLAAMLRRDHLAQQHRAHGPFGAEADALQHPGGEQLLVVLGEARQGREDREPQDGQLQDPRPPEPVAEPAAQPAADRRGDIVGRRDVARLRQRHAERGDQDGDHVLEDQPVGAVHRPAGAARPEDPARLGVRLAVPTHH